MNRPLLERALAALKIVYGYGPWGEDMTQLRNAILEIRAELDKPPLIDCGCAILKNGDCYQVYAVKMNPAADD
jgi:hypothetical protein